jgi:hypothetical protein
MSLEALLAEDSITVVGQDVHKDDSGGPTRSRPARARNVPARVQALGSVQVRQLGSLLIEATHKVITQYSGIANGDLIVTSDGAKLRVQGIILHRAIGGMDSYYEIPCLEVKPTATVK